MDRRIALALAAAAVLLVALTWPGASAASDRTSPPVVRMAPAANHATRAAPATP